MLDLNQIQTIINSRCRVTTAKPATTKKNNAETNNELIRQLDDLFQDS